jgi:cytolysin (calcineurin-like family phosphatase)
MLPSCLIRRCRHAMNVGRWVAAGWFLAGSGMSFGQANFDITFYATGDPHYKAYDGSSPNNNPTVRTNLGKLKALKGIDMPAVTNLKVGTPLGVILAGDIVDGGSETNPVTGAAEGSAITMPLAWRNFVANWGLLGNEAGALIDFPVYEGFGNHDQNGFWKTSAAVENILDKLAERNPSRPFLTAQSGTYQYVGAYSNAKATGVHYAWKWGPFHFVQCSMRVGDSQLRYPCAGSLTFLKDYLEKVVGNSGEPVFVIHHLPPAAPEGDWPVADQRAYYDLIKGYNIAGLFVAHTHSYGDYTWSGPDNGAKALRVYQFDSIAHSGATQGYCSVFRLLSTSDPTKARLVVVQRKRDGTWGTVVERTIDLPTTTVVPNDLGVIDWRSVNTHAGVACSLVASDNNFIEPRAAGIRQVEVNFSEAVAVANLSQAVTITGATSAGAVTLGGLGITATATATGSKLTLTFSNAGGACALPDVGKWRFTLNSNVISSGTGGALSVSVNNSRVISGLVGDSTGSGRVSGMDLSQISTTAAFDPSNAKALRADIDGNGVINTLDRDGAWANQTQILEKIATP